MGRLVLIFEMYLAVREKNIHVRDKRQMQGQLQKKKKNVDRSCSRGKGKKNTNFKKGY